MFSNIYTLATSTPHCGRRLGLYLYLARHILALSLWHCNFDIAILALPFWHCHFDTLAISIIVISKHAPPRIENT